MQNLKWYYGKIALPKNMTTLKARNLSLGDVRKLLGFQPIYNGSFASQLVLEPLATNEQQELAQIQTEFRNYLDEGKVLEGQVRLIAIAPLLRLAGYNRPPIRLHTEEEIARIYIEDEDTMISGRFDIVAVNKEQTRENNVFLWILVVESKNSSADSSAGLPQLLTYAVNSLKYQESVWGLSTNGYLYQFFYIRRGQPHTYEYMPVLSLMESDRSVEILQVLKSIVQMHL